MTTMTNPRTPGSAVAPGQSLMALARAEALRFARHPLFLVSAAVMFLATAVGVANQKVVDVGVEGTVLPAFFVGVFGFVVAHRLTTSLRRSGDLADTAPVSAQRRTLALCLACLVPMTLGILVVLSSVLFGAIWPPSLPDGHVAWFGYEPDLTIWAILFGDVVLACLGGPLLGVAVARWAPFRGSALLGMAVLVIGASTLASLPSPWYVVSPYALFSDEHLENGKYQISWVRDGVSPVWWCGYAACLCGLAVLAALLRHDAGRRRLLTSAGVLVALAVGFALVAVA
jgi:hypothetical protein